MCVPDFEDVTRSVLGEFPVAQRTAGGRSAFENRAKHRCSGANRGAGAVIQLIATDFDTR
jgi:hypothetical protein